MIYSCTMYNGEADVLEIRLGQLAGVVDRHILCEGTTTQRGNPKPLHFLEPRSLRRFAPWAEQIDYRVVQLGRRGEQGDWAREHEQRDQGRLSLGGLQPEDLVLVSDVDEIPDPAWLRAEFTESAGAFRLEMSMHLYYLNWRWREVPVRYGTRATLISGAKLLEHPDKTLTQYVEAGWPSAAEPCGWHLAYQLEPAEIRTKLLNIADIEFAPYAERPLEHFEYCRRTGWDLFNREYRQCDWVGDEHLPPYAVANRERFAHMLIDEPIEAVA